MSEPCKHEEGGGGLSPDEKEKGISPEKLDKKIEQAVAIAEQGMEIKNLKEDVSEMRGCMGEVKETLQKIQVSLLEFRLEVTQEQGKKPSWPVAIAITFLVGLVSALSVFVITRGIG